MYDLRGQVAVVTGAGGPRGIGRAILLRLAAEGADVVAVDLPPGAQGSGPDAEAVAAEARALGRRALAVPGDVGDPDAASRVLEAALETFGRVDILVNNAAAPPGADRAPVVDVEPEAFDAVLRVNVRGAFLCARAAARHMIARGGGGRILNLSSCLGKRGRANYAAYCASKFALLGFTEALALELAAHRITVNALCPGPVDTERFDRVAEGAAAPGESPAQARGRILADRAGRTPLGRVGLPSDVAAVAAFLASREAEFLTGMAVDVTGGFDLA
ncbi:MAG: SDR family oxidoreductase [Holophagaceae bacterium]